MRFYAVIPARHASSRLPGKPLAPIAGRPMVVHVCERARASGADAVWVATDDARVAEAVEAAGFAVLMTREDHVSGTERLVEVVERLGWPDETTVVNVQGDEPLIEPDAIRLVASTLAEAPDAAMATLAYPILDVAEFTNPNVVKVVADANGRARYFSRAPIPWPRDAFASGTKTLPAHLGALRHVGLYAYRAGFLRRYSRLAPSPLEGIEMLEQLRVLWHGHDIALAVLDGAPAPGVDTPEDLERVRRLVGET